MQKTLSARRARWWRGSYSPFGGGKAATESKTPQPKPERFAKWVKEPI